MNPKARVPSAHLLATALLLIATAVLAHPIGHWKLLPAPVPADPVQISFVDDNNGWLLGLTKNGTAVYKHCTTAPRGWCLLREMTGRQFSVMHFTDTQHGYLAGTAGELVRTEDGGQSWSATATGMTNTILDVSGFNNKVWAVGEHGAAIKSSDYGNAWSHMTLPQIAGTLSLKRVRFVTANEGWIAGIKVHDYKISAVLLKTLNGGTSWMDMTSRLSPEARNGGILDFELPRSSGWLYVLGSSAKLHVSTDDGDTFQTVSLKFLTPMFSISMADGRFGLIVGSYGRTATTVDAGFNWQHLYTDLPPDESMASRLTYVFMINRLRGFAINAHGNVFEYSAKGW